MCVTNPSSTDTSDITPTVLFDNRTSDLDGVLEKFEKSVGFDTFLHEYKILAKQVKEGREKKSSLSICRKFKINLEIIRRE